MKHATRIGRLVGLAVGMSIGAALAAIPGVASADELDFQISIGGYDLIPAADTTATATSGTGDIAIAIGDGANATATGGFGDSAFADGAGSTADLGHYGVTNLSAAIASGADSTAQVWEGSFDFSSASGDDSAAYTGYGNFDNAQANGTDSGAIASGNESLTTFNPANDDVAYAWGPHTSAASGDLITTTPSSNDIAAVFDPFGTVGSAAYAGDGNFDLAAVLGLDNVVASAVGANFLVDILPSL
jgi:hypothetical protein